MKKNSNKDRRNAGKQGVWDALLEVEGDFLVISDHENRLLLNREAALELLERLPVLAAKLPRTTYFRESGQLVKNIRSAPPITTGTPLIFANQSISRNGTIAS